MTIHIYDLMFIVPLVLLWIGFGQLRDIAELDR